MIMKMTLMNKMIIRMNLFQIRMMMMKLNHKSLSQTRVILALKLINKRLKHNKVTILLVKSQLSNNL